MTWSIVARDRRERRLRRRRRRRGSSPSARSARMRESGAGALATQALVNPHLRAARAAPARARACRRRTVVRRLLAEPTTGARRASSMSSTPPGATPRIPARTASTGAAISLRDGFSVAGNMLAGARVVARHRRAYEAIAALPFAERLIAALEAGRGGGRRQARQAIGGADHPFHRGVSRARPARRRPCRAARRAAPPLREGARALLPPFMPVPADASAPSGTYDRAVIDAEIARSRRRRPELAMRPRRWRADDGEDGAPLLEVTRPAHPFRQRRRRVPRRRRRRASRSRRGRTLGIVGESGCGKSVTALSIMGLVPQPPGRIAGGEVLFDGVDLLQPAAERELRELRGDRLAMIFQEPMTSLNPAFTIGDQIVEAHPAPSRAEPHGGARSRRSRCCAACASRRRSSASTTIRTSSRAACASA